MEIPALELYEFPGDVPSRCELIEGPITDFSVFIKKAEVEPLIEIVDIKSDELFVWKPLGRWNFVFLIEGELETSAGLLSAGNTVSIEFEDLSSERGEFQFKANQNSKCLFLSLGELLA